MNILVTGANGQLGNEMRIIAQNSSDEYIFTDVNQMEGIETTYLDITDYEPLHRLDIYVEDNVHYNQEGYQLYGEYFKEKLAHELAKF